MVIHILNSQENFEFLMMVMIHGLNIHEKLSPLSHQ